MSSNSLESEAEDSLLRPRPIKLSPPRISSTVAPLSSVLRLPSSNLRLRLIAAHHQKQIAAILFVEVFPCRVVHRQMIGRDYDHGVFKPRRGFDLIDQRRDVLLATGDGAERLVGFAIIAVTFALAGARDKTVRMVGIHGQRKQRKAFARGRDSSS